MEYEEYGLFKKKLREKGFSEEQIAVIIEVKESVCILCLDGPSNCHCEHEE